MFVPFQLHSDFGTHKSEQDYGAAVSELTINKKGEGRSTPDMWNI